MDTIADAQANVQSYADQIAAVAKQAVGRPDTVARWLNTLADGALRQLAVAAAEAGVEPKCEIAMFVPDHVTPDSHNEHGHARPQPGLLEPKHNKGFIAGHRANLRALRRALAAVEKAAAR